MHALMLAGIVAAASVVAIGTIGFLRLRQKPRCPCMARPLAEADFNALATRPGWRAQTLHVATGIELRGLMREAATPAGPWILFFGGNSAGVLDESQQILDALCAERGWGCVVWAYRGYDSSGGVSRPSALAADGFKSWSQLLAQRNVLPPAVHVVGYSLGTFVAAAVAARAGANPPASLTLLAPSTRFYVGERTQLLLHCYDMSKWLRSVACPTLVIHGVLDDTLMIQDGHSVAKTLGALASLVELPEVGHNDLPLSPAAQDALRAFVGRNSAAVPA